MWGGLHLSRNISIAIRGSSEAAVCFQCGFLLYQQVYLFSGLPARTGDGGGGARFVLSLIGFECGKTVSARALQGRGSDSAAGQHQHAARTDRRSHGSGSGLVEVSGGAEGQIS